LTDILESVIDYEENRTLSAAREEDAVEEQEDNRRSQRTVMAASVA
jgi:hypothetical protein